MRMRRSVIHWIGDKNLPGKLEDSELQAIAAKVKLGDRAAGEKLILHHIRLGMAKVAEFAGSYPNKTEELVSGMLWGLVRGTTLIEQGSLQHDNVTAYLMSHVIGSLKKTITRDRLVPRCRQIKMRDRVTKSEPTSDLKELIKLSIQTEQEQRIIDFRLAGWNDPEIAEMMGLTKGRIQQIRSKVKDRLQELMEPLNGKDNR